VNTTVIERLTRRSTLTDDCWFWDGARNGTGYGCIAIGGKSQLVHRVSYLEHKGPIPDGLVVDHLCHNSDHTCLGGPTCEHRRCWRPEHLEAVSSGVNTARSPLTGTHRTHCPRGHAYDAHNTRVHNGRRCCKRCGHEASAKASAKTLAASDGHPPTWTVGKSSYQRGCRCDGCRAANTAWFRVYREPKQIVLFPAPAPTPVVRRQAS
jgi:hypothetical protein